MSTGQTLQPQIVQVGPGTRDPQSRTQDSGPQNIQVGPRTQDPKSETCVTSNFL